MKKQFSKYKTLTFLFLLGMFMSVNVLGQEKDKLYEEFNFEFEFEYRYFFKEGLYPGQKQHFPSIAFRPEYYLEWAEGNQSLNFSGFLRIDRDERRTHWDIREMYWQMVKSNWELSVGAKKVFWGVTESNHLVDIINQTDIVESFDGEAKLGQPMIHFSYLTKIGTFDLFAMPYFRVRIYPGEMGRLRPPFLLEKSDFSFQSDLEEWHPDFAIRWSNSINVFDIGISHFYGTGREPLILFNNEGNVTDLIYPIIHQTGLDLQATTGPVLWKFEGISRLNEYQNVIAFVSGLEYTFGNVKNSGIDIGLISEYLYDSRGDLAFSSLANDLFVGSRIAFNDTQSTEFLFGGIFDLEKSSKIFSLEASRRFGEDWKVSVEARIMSNIEDTEFLYFFRDDSFVSVQVLKFF